MPVQGLFQPAHTEALYADLLRANTEQAKKERFLQYVSIVFAGDKSAQALISAITLGAERIITNISRQGRATRGRADTQTETVIIEWERDLARTGEHARQQLEEYLEGNWRSGQEYRFILLATDGIHWRRYAPDWSRVAFGDFQLGRNFQLREVRRFDLSPSTFTEFPFFLDEVLFASQPRAATLENIQADFGDTSSVFINSMACLQKCTDDIESHSELRVAFEQWRRFLSIAYGKFDNSPTMFLVHTYLSVFAKFIAYVVVTRRAIADEAVIKAILDGTVFEELNIERFVEDDFFHWVGASTFFKRLRVLFREVSAQLAHYDFSDVREDILKGVYQDLIDLETRHALGEYYTPDWLCERIVDDLKVSKDSSFLDPACGSGSFLRAVVSRMRREFPNLKADVLTEQVVGIDIHPLSVLISKTTMLLALGPTVSKARRPVTLHIYLANSLLVPRGTADLFKENFQIAVDNKDYVLDVKGLNGAEDFDKLIGFCDDLVRRYGKRDPIERAEFLRLAKGNMPPSVSRDLPAQLYDVYRGMKVATVEGRDSIWKFILQNSYKPVFLMGRFDYVVGNPPWLTYSAISNHEYQILLRRLSDDYGVTPSSLANMPHLEIAAIFFAHAVNYFLRDGGDLAFVLPRSFMSADQHDNIRAGNVEGVQVRGVWDLQDVTPLFRVPSCVFFAKKTARPRSGRQIPASGLPGLSLSGRLPRFQVHWSDASHSVRTQKHQWFYSQLQAARGKKRSALTAQPLTALVGSNAYVERFTQGATIVPRNFYFVETSQQIEEGDRVTDRVLSIRTSAASEREAKPPWKGQVLSGRAEGGLLYRTAISRNVIPFGLVEPPLVVLPVVGGDGKHPFEVLSAEALLEQGYSYGSAWFYMAEERWERSKTERNSAKAMSLRDRLDFQRGLTGQNPRARYLVLYTSSSTDASAVVVDRTRFDRPFIVDHKTYWCECATAAEAHYLSAYINSNYANEAIKEFQSRGLFGPRDVHKLIVKVPFPKFQKNNSDHERLAEFGSNCADLVSRFISESEVADLQARALGRLRVAAKHRMTNELDEIDALVEHLSRGVGHGSGSIRRKPKRRRPGTRSLFD